MAEVGAHWSVWLVGLRREAWVRRRAVVEGDHRGRLVRIEFALRRAVVLVCMALVQELLLRVVRLGMDCVRVGLL